MAVLTIARELGAIAGGEELTFCNALNLSCISKATLEKRFSDLGIEQTFLARFDECKPGLAGCINNSAGYYWETLRTVIMQELLNDNIAIFGRGGNFLLDGLVKFFSIRLIAPEDIRIRHVAAVNSISESEALKLIRQSDSTREKFCNYYYGKSWSDPHNYDLVVNTANISMDDLPQMIAPMLANAEREVDRKQLELLIKTQIIKHALFAIPELQLRYPDIFCDADGRVTLRGNIPSTAAMKRAVETVRKIDGVNEVVNELVIVHHDLQHMPPFMH
ncbi:MAG: BON domain-containing protein [Lentisphaerae bacterium]|nr:BON domain-containing protein [Lentisphaerota bacterium]